jgi:hypothetical protein
MRTLAQLACTQAFYVNASSRTNREYDPDNLVRFLMSMSAARQSALWLSQMALLCGQERRVTEVIAVSWNPSQCWTARFWSHDRTTTS